MITIATLIERFQPSCIKALRYESNVRNGIVNDSKSRFEDRKLLNILDLMFEY